MYLSRLYIKNFRSIQELDLPFSKGKNVIVGRNNIGKSNIIRAMNIVLGQSNPTFAKSENITHTDFYTWREALPGQEAMERSSDGLFIWCELERDRGEALNYDEMYKCIGFYVHTRITDWSNRQPVKEPIRFPNDRLPTDYELLFDITEDDSSEKEYVNPKRRDQRPLERSMEDKHHFAFAFRATKDEDGKIEKDIRFLMREDMSSDWVLCFRAPIRNELLQSAIIPSFRDPQNQLRLTALSWYGKLIRHLTEGCSDSPDLLSAFAQVKEAGDRVFAHATSTIEQSSLRTAFPGTSLHFQFNAEKRDDLYKSCIIYVDDGFKSQLDEKGSGIQSAIVIGLFNYYTKYVNTVSSALLCIEEPEVYLHPHARRVVSDRLDEFLDDNRNQVIITTHSSDFVRSVLEDLNVIVVQKVGQETKAVPVNIKAFKPLLIDNRKSELFFADKAIVCEGLDEYILSAVAEEAFPGRLDEQNVSIVSAGGKDNIRTLVTLTLRLGIKSFIFADFDYLLRDDSPECKDYGAKAHGSVESLGSRFFCQDCILGARGDKAHALVQKLCRALKSEDIELFYTAKRELECNGVDTAKDMSTLLKGLRNNGICIMSCQIEDLVKDTSFLSPGEKIDLSKVFALKAILAQGRKMADIFDTSQIVEFLTVVLER